MRILWNKVTWYSKFLALVLFILLPLWAFVLGRVYQVVLDQDFLVWGSSFTTFISPSSSYAPSTWKLWQDGELVKGTKTYTGYTMMYPRDFDAMQGEFANGGLIGQTRVKLAFPEDAFNKSKTNFNEAYAAISFGTDKGSLGSCYTNPNPSTGAKKLTDTVVVNGTTFYKSTTTDAGAGNLYTTELYRTLKDKHCYEVALTVHTSNIANYDPGTVAEFDKEKAFAVLRKMLATFTLTNVNPFQ